MWIPHEHIFFPGPERAGLAEGHLGVSGGQFWSTSERLGSTAGQVGWAATLTCGPGATVVTSAPPPRGPCLDGDTVSQPLHTGRRWEFRPCLCRLPLSAPQGPRLDCTDEEALPRDRDSARTARLSREGWLHGKATSGEAGARPPPGSPTRWGGGRAPTVRCWFFWNSSSRHLHTATRSPPGTKPVTG